MGRRPKQTFLQRRLTDSQEAHEKLLNIISHHGKANQNHSEISLICISLMVSDVEHRLMCLLVIRISFLEKQLFKYFLQFLNQVFCIYSFKCMYTHTQNIYIYIYKNREEAEKSSQWRVTSMVCVGDRRPGKASPLCLLCQVLEGFTCHQHVSLIE